MKEKCKKDWKRDWKKALTGGMAVCMLLGNLSAAAWAEEPQELNGSAMGRYLETEVELPENVYPAAMNVTVDGKLRILGQNYEEKVAGLWDSSDGGATWELAAEFPEEYADLYFSAAALAADGGGAGIIMDAAEASEINDYRFIFAAFDEQGNVTTTDLGNMSADMPAFLSFHQNGTLTGVSYGGSAVLMDRNTGEIAAELCSNGELVAPCGNEILVLTENSELLPYDLESREPLGRDEALEEAFFADGISYEQTIGGGYPVVFGSDAEGRLYYCNKKGIFTHMPGGSTVEQVVDGSLNSLSDPTNVWQGIAVQDQTFYVLGISSVDAAPFIRKYEYDPDISSVPERELTIYSLEENDGVRQAISLFQKKYPDTYVNYQIGMSGGEGVTAEDALRTLNTDILAGSGPDILLLDGMSVETYVEKGLLIDLTDILQGVGEADGLLENVAYTYRQDGGTFAVPACFSIPVIVGKKEWIDSVQGMEDLIKLAGQQDVLDSWNGSAMAALLYPVCAGSWRKEDGTFDQEKLAEYVRNMKEFHDTWMESASSESLEELNYLVGWEAALQGSNNISMGDLSLAGGKCQAYVGELSGGRAYSGVSSVNKVTGDCSIALLNGQQSGVFVPHMILGILNTARETGRAVDFVNYMLAKEGQMIDQNSGFPVNAQALHDTLYIPAFEDGEMSAYAENNQTGESIELFYYWPTEEELNDLDAMVQSLNVRADSDRIIMQAVLEQVYRCVDGELSVDETVNSIMQTVNLYLAE
ncbi:MAG: extracellular solute-binding protein [Lachnospiraceae bacterium]|nr:extracellular solute-binding protein [Lachnospiraceae bacterium]